MNYHFENIKNCEMCNEPIGKNATIGLRMNQSQSGSLSSKAGIAVSVQKCKSCKLIFSNPMPVPKDLQDHYGSPPEDYWKKEYFEIDSDYFSEQIHKAKELLGMDKIKSLDIGAGIGKAMISMEAAGFDSYGFEPSNSFYKKAIEEMHIEKSKLRLGSIEDIDYPREVFDFITYGAVLEHLYHPAACIQKTLDWLKPGGVIHIEVPSSNWLISKLINLINRIRGTQFVTNLSPMHTPFHLYEFDIKSFEGLAKRLNFDIVYSKIDVCSIYFVPRIFHPFFRWFMNKTGQGLQLTVYLQKKE
jgi:2-polyprenyl-3-methyl-5-hydroxy-6-metoxy-1,4-benzoquinol methylase